MLDLLERSWLYSGEVLEFKSEFDSDLQCWRKGIFLEIWFQQQHLLNHDF